MSESERKEAECLAASSEQMKEIDMGWGFTRVQGRPHLSIGTRVLLEHPVAMAIAIMQCIMVPVLIHDTAIYFKLTHILHSFFGSEFSSMQLWIRPGLISPIYALLVSLFMMNVLWAMMASEIAGRPLSSKCLLAGFMGWLPMPAMRSLILPHWVLPKFKGVREAIWGSARMSQVLGAFWAGNGYSKDRSDLALARSLDRHGDEIVDGLSSYVMYPAFMLGIILLLWVLSLKIGLFHPEMSGQEQAGHGSPFLSLTVGDVILIYTAWLAYNRAALFAMMMHFMSEVADAPVNAVTGDARKIDWHYWIGVSIESAAIGFVFFALIGKFFKNMLA